MVEPMVEQLAPEGSEHVDTTNADVAAEAVEHEETMSDKAEETLKPAAPAVEQQQEEGIKGEEIHPEAVSEQENGSTNTVHDHVELLAPELMVRVLGYMDVCDRVQLAGCNRTLSKRVYDDCPQAWTVVSFEKVKVACRQRLTDANLATILSKVHAKDVTQALDLFGCKEIRGHGLAPLRCSTVFEMVRLQGTCAKNNLTPFLWILQTLFPFKFRAVLVDYDIYDHPPKELRDFLWKLREAMLLRVDTDSTMCCGCQQPVVDPSRQVIPKSLGLPEHFCLKCVKPFCRTGGCPISIHECAQCGESYCQDCNDHVKQCDFCGISHCEADVCGGTFDSCLTCGKLCCKDCRGKIVNCDYCKKRKTCLDCANYDVCAEDCTVCVTCQAKGNCSVCKEQFCIQCIREDVRECHKCHLVFCDKQACTSLIESCKASICSLVHCRQCLEFEFCIACEKSFCLEHERLVDCFKCGMRHCRQCGFEKRCPWCTRSCYDDCFCTEMHPSAAKKAKTSPESTS